MKRLNAVSAEVLNQIEQGHGAPPTARSRREVVGALKKHVRKGIITNDPTINNAIHCMGVDESETPKDQLIQLGVDVGMEISPPFTPPSGI
mmetsp:Transcript_28286/g.49086  ORF Transcript_28286/g.49086 Transcript_28286/m.49086 type:complete len:91 (+) Transcript_28286:2-274(+)